MTRLAIWTMAGVLGAGMLCTGSSAQGTTGAQGGSQPGSQTGTQTTHRTSSSKAAIARRRAAARRRAQRQASAPGAVRVLSMEAAPPSAPRPDETAAQKAADARLLEQQKQQSAQAAQITDQQVQQAQKQKEQIQNEVSIQDAPGPAQTGVVPAAGAPVAPVNSNDRIQDAPGPAQTLPAPATAPQPATAPASTPPRV